VIALTGPRVTNASLALAVHGERSARQAHGPAQAHVVAHDVLLAPRGDDDASAFVFGLDRLTALHEDTHGLIKGTLGRWRSGRGECGVAGAGDKEQCGEGDGSHRSIVINLCFFARVRTPNRHQASTEQPWCG